MRSGRQAVIEASLPGTPAPPARRMKGLPVEATAPTMPAAGSPSASAITPEASTSRVRLPGPISNNANSSEPTRFATTSRTAVTTPAGSAAPCRLLTATQQIGQFSDLLLGAEKAFGAGASLSRRAACSGSVACVHLRLRAAERHRS